MIILFNKEPLVIAQRTGISRVEAKPEAFSAFTARSSPKIPAVFFAATLLIIATSSSKTAISSNTAKNPEAIYSIFEDGAKLIYFFQNKSLKVNLTFLCKNNF